MNEIQKRQEADKAAKQNREALERCDTMLYKYPGNHKIDGDFYEYTIVPKIRISEMQSDGWSLTPASAKDAHLNAKIAKQEAEAEKKPETNEASEPPKKRGPGRPPKNKES